MEIKNTQRKFSVYLFISNIDSVFTIGKNYYAQVFLEVCKYVIKEKKMHQYITDDVEICSDENSDEKNSDKEHSHEDNYTEE